AETTISVVPSKNVVRSLTVTPSDRDLPANNADSYTVTARVVDEKGAPLAGQEVAFSVSGLLNQNGESGAILSAPGTSQKRNSDSVTAKTGADGKAVVSLRSTAAGQGRVTATMVNGNTGSAKVVFVPDTATAHVSAVTL